MKPNSTKPTGALEAERNAGKLVPMPQQQHHQQQHNHHRQQQPQQSIEHYRQMQPAGVAYPQQPLPQQTAQHYEYQQQGCPAEMIVVPSTSSHGQHQPQQQSMQMPSGFRPTTGPLYHCMAQPSPHPMATSPVGFSASVQPCPGCPRQWMMSQQRSLSSQPTVVEYASAGPTGAQQQYRHQQPGHPTHTFHWSPRPSRQQQVCPFPSTPHPERSTAEAQYFLDPNCTVPVVPPKPRPSPAAGCDNPKCANYKSFKRN